MYAALLFVVCSLPFVDLEVFQVAGKSMVLPYVAAFLLAIPLLARPSRFSAAVRDPTLPFLLAWLVVAGISTGLAVLRYQDEPILRWDRSTFVTHNATQLVNLGMMVCQYALFICALRAISPEQLPRLMRVFVAVGVILGVYSLYQIGTVLYGWPHHELFRTSNLYLKAPTLHPEGYGSWIRVPRAYGTAPEPSMWGGYVIIVMAFLLGRLTYTWTARDLLRLAVMAAALLVTFSRASWLSLAILAPLWLIALPQRRVPRLALQGVVVLAIVWTFAPALIGERSAGFGDLSALDRLSANKTGLNAFFDNPLFGIGLGSFRFLIDKYLFSMEGYNQVLFFTVFNYFLLVFVSTGVIGGLLFVAFLFAVLRRLWRAFQIDTADRGLLSLRVGSALATVAILAFWLNTPAYNFSYLWFCLALASVLPEHLAASADRVSRSSASMEAACT